MMKKRTNSKDFTRSRQRRGSAEASRTQYQDTEKIEKQHAMNVHFEAWNPASDGLSNRSNGPTTAMEPLSSNHCNSEQQESQVSTTDNEEINMFVQELLLQMRSRFGTLEASINCRMDKMGRQIDELDQEITALMERSGVDPKDVQHVASSSSSTQFRL